MSVNAPKTTAHLAYLKRLEAGQETPPPIALLIGFTMHGVSMGQVTAELQPEKRHANPMGTLHGGIICDVADAAMGMAFSSTLEDDESFTTLDLTTKFLKPVWTERIRATANVIKRTRTTGLIECDVTDPSGSLVAKVWSTCMVLRGDSAKGR